MLEDMNQLHINVLLRLLIDKGVFTMSDFVDEQEAELKRWGDLRKKRAQK